MSETEKNFLNEKEQNNFDNAKTKKTLDFKEIIKNKKIVTFSIIAIVLFLATLIFIVQVVIKNNEIAEKYDLAMSYYNSEEYDEAIPIFRDLSDYKESKKFLKESQKKSQQLEKFNQGVELFKTGEFEDSIDVFEECKSFNKDAEKYLTAIKYIQEYSGKFEGSERVYTSYKEIVNNIDFQLTAPYTLTIENDDEWSVGCNVEMDVTQIVVYGSITYKTIKDTVPKFFYHDSTTADGELKVTAKDDSTTLVWIENTNYGFNLSQSYYGSYSKIYLYVNGPDSMKIREVPYSSDWSTQYLNDAVECYLSK